MKTENQERADRVVTECSWRVEICHEELWGAYYGRKTQDPDNDNFTGWVEDPDELLRELYNHLPQRVYDAVAEAVGAMSAGVGAADMPCKWVVDPDADVWESDCGRFLIFNDNDGGPKDNGFEFCPFCGSPIEAAGGDGGGDVR